jgi:hypothetical protein
MRWCDNEVKVTQAEVEAMKAQIRAETEERARQGVLPRTWKDTHKRRVAIQKKVRR